MMLRRLIVIALLLFSVRILAAGAVLPIELEKVKINTHDIASVLRGAKFFAQHCMVCHTMKYLQHNKLAKEAGITLDKMPLKEQDWIYGIVPPDLTLIAKLRSPDWLYTYFHSFYKDASRPTGYNNLLMPNVNMMNVFAPLQGQQALVESKQTIYGHMGLRKPHYYTVLKLVKAGSMTPEQFNQTMTDLVNFLVYASDPHKAARESLGYWVMGFLLIFLVVAYLLKKAYWKQL